MSLYGVEGPAGQVLMICTVVFGCLLGLAVLVSCKRLVGMMCDAKSPRVGPSSAGNKYAQLMVRFAWPPFARHCSDALRVLWLPVQANESLFRDEHPMKLPDLHTDLHRPVQWASLFYEDTPSTSQFNFAGDRIIFADKSSNIDDPTAISQLRSTHVDWRHTGADRGAARPDTNPETYTMCGQAYVLCGCLVFGAWCLVLGAWCLVLGKCVCVCVCPYLWRCAGVVSWPPTCQMRS